MAQISIQYAFDTQLGSVDEQYIRSKLDKLQGIHHIQLQHDQALLCVDYDDTVISDTQLEEAVKDCGYAMNLVDKITF